MRNRPPAVALGLLALLLAGCERVSTESAPISERATYGQTGRSPGQFVYPRGIDADSESIWVVDKSARVQRFDVADGAVTAGFATPESELGKPTGVTVAPGPAGEEVLYIADTHYHRILIYEIPARGQTPTLLGSFGEYGPGDGQFIYPTDVAVLTGSDGGVERIYVSEYGGNDRVSVFDASHAFLFSFGSPDEGEVQFNRPQSLGIEPELDEVIVVDACNHRIGRFTLDGELVDWIGAPETAGGEPGAFAYPYGLSLPGNATALFSEYGNGRVQHIDLETGESLGLFGVPGRGEGKLMNPWGVALIDDIVYVLDSGSDRVVSFKAPRRARKVDR